MARHHGFVAASVVSAALLLTEIVAAVPAAAQAAPAAVQQGIVSSGGLPIAGASVRLFATGGPRGNRLLGRATTQADGTFRIAIAGDAGPRETRYLVADGGRRASGQADELRFATVLGRGRAPLQVTINERTTVATAFALAQFIHGGRIDGPSPGLPNAARTLRNLVSIRTGAIGRVLARPPNGRQTSTLATFQSLANLLAGCARSAAKCQRLFRLAHAPGTPRPVDTLAAAHGIATAPTHRAAALFRLSLRTSVYQPALEVREAPRAWTLALRYDGGGRQFNGPGEAAIDRAGNAWITNNYVFSLQPRDPRGIVCGDDHLLKLRPDGRNAPGAPYEGGGAYGVGFGITIGRDGDVWTGSFGFQGSNCPVSPAEQAARSKSVSQYAASGAAISPDASASSPGGWPGRQGAIDRPQGMATDRTGNIWVASCGSDRVIRFRKGDPDQDAVFSAPRLRKPFDLTVDPQARVWATGNEGSTVLAFDQGGRVVRRVTGDRADRAGILQPMGIASDSQGNIWVSNSGILRVPCGEQPDASTLLDTVRRTLRPGFSNEGASVTMLRPSGRPHPRAPFKGAGLVLPWGIAIDGDDTVWVANFSGQRLSHLCGATTSKCPAGKRRVGAPISPRGGYGFDGLVRNTGVAIDPSGNVWLANNWRTAPNPPNPGGHQMVVFLGLAEPVRTPLQGAPRTP